MRHPRPTTGANADESRRLEVITSVGRRRRWTAEERAWIVAESLDPAARFTASGRNPHVRHKRLGRRRWRGASTPTTCRVSYRRIEDELNVELCYRSYRQGLHAILDQEKAVVAG